MNIIRHFLRINKKKLFLIYPYLCPIFNSKHRDALHPFASMMQRH